MRKVICLSAIAVALAVCCLTAQEGFAEEIAPTLKVGHVGHDHHIALFVAADNAEEYGKQTGIYLKPIEDRKLYELMDGDRKVADVEVVVVGGGSKMPTALAQNIIDVGLGGTAAVLAAADSGAPVKLIAPLHCKGDMFVVAPDFPAKSWEEFVQAAKATETPFRIGYKNPVAVAKVILEEALRHEGISFSGNLSKTDVKVHMINVKGGSRLNTSLGGGLIDGYVGNNPFPAIGAEKGMLRIICDLEELPPGKFRNHPCCCLAANTKALADKHEAIVDLLVLMLQATETINADLDAAVESATKWIGTSKSVERVSIATSGYSMEITPEWHAYMATWIETMNALGVLKEKLKGLDEGEVATLVYELSPLKEAKTKLANARATK